MDSFPSLRTKRLKLNQIKSEDIPAIINYAGNINVSKSTLHVPHPYTEKDAIHWINAAIKGFENGSQFTFAVRLNHTDEFIGGLGLKINVAFKRASLGYWIAEPFWNHGYTTEAVQAILVFGFNTLQLNKIYATHILDNPASGKVMIKNGMIKEGEMRDHYRKNGNYQTVIQYRLTKEEFDNLPS